MKRIMAILALSALSFAAQAQQREHDSIPAMHSGISPLDSMTILVWNPELKHIKNHEEVAEGMPVVSMSSVMMQRTNTRRNIVVLPNNVLQLFPGGIVTVSNGQAQNWGLPYPQGYRDARTLSMPAPR